MKEIRWWAIAELEQSSETVGDLVVSKFRGSARGRRDPHMTWLLLELSQISQQCRQLLGLRLPIKMNPIS